MGRWHRAVAAAACVAAAAWGPVDLASLAAPSLSAETLLEFERNGHVATRGLLSSREFLGVARSLRDVAEAEREAAEEHAEEFVAADLSDIWGDGEEGAGYEEAEEGEEEEEDSGGYRGGLGQAPPFLQVFNPHRRHAAARDLALSPVLAATAAALLGVACVRLYQDCLFWKRPGHDATSWHADLWTAPLATNAAVTVWLPLHRVEVGDAPLFFKSHSHRDMSAMVHAGQLEELGLDQAECPPPGESGAHHAPLSEGDATWHHGWTVHGAPALAATGAAESSGGRLAYAATYFADGAKVLLAAPEPEDGPSYADWLPDVEPGSLAAHELLPVAYPLP